MRINIRVPKKYQRLLLFGHCWQTRPGNLMLPARPNDRSSGEEKRGSTHLAKKALVGQPLVYGNVASTKK